MFAKPREEPGSKGRWFEEESEQTEYVGSTEPGDGQQSRSWEDETYEDEHFYHRPGSNRNRPPVAMETASTDGSDSDRLRNSVDEGDLYTSLLSSHSYLHGPSFSRDNQSQAQDRIPSLESGSGIEMTPGDFARALLESEKMEAYNYMDISHVERPRAQQQDGAQGSWGEAGRAGPGQYLEKSATPVVETLGPVLDAQAFPYVEDPSDEELSDYQPRPARATPLATSTVRFTLTETEAPTPQRPPQVTVSDRDSILSLGLQGIPTVTLSEPEDDSPGSSTPPLTEESDSPSDPLFQASGAGDVSSAQSQVSVSGSAPTQPDPPAERGVKTSTPKPPPTHDQDGSSAESGDSEIELVSEEPPPPRKQPPGTACTSPAPSAPAPPLVPAPPVQYSILREEREAELDSELIIESFDASSASEESPKRGQGSPAQKGRRAGSRPVEAPPAPPSRAAPSPPAAPASAVPPAGAQKPATSEKGDNAPVVRPKPSPATVVPPPPPPPPPEVRLEQTAPEENGGKKRSASEGRRDSERRATAPAFLQALGKQKAMDLLYWRDLKQTGPVFGSAMLLLFSLTQFSVVSVIAYLALAALSATISFRVYKSVLQAVQKTDEGHPFKSYLDVEVCLSQDQMQSYAEKVQHYINSTLKELRRLFLVQDLVDSLKFAVLMWLLTYVGALFNGLTLLILAVVSMFSMPVVYEKYQTQIDQYLGLVRTHVGSVVAKVQEKIPGVKRKEE